MKQTTTLVTGLAASLFALGAYAGDYGKKASFESLDADSNGQISATEAQAHSKLSQKMAQLDTDGDGSLSQTEFAAMESSAPATRTATSDGTERNTGTETTPTTAPTPSTAKE